MTRYCSQMQCSASLQQAHNCRLPKSHNCFCHKEHTIANMTATKVCTAVFYHMRHGLPHSRDICCQVDQNKLFISDVCGVIVRGRCT